MTGTIAQQVRAMAEASAGGPHNELMEAFSAEQLALAASGLPPGIIGVGEVLPDASLLDPHGAPISLYHAIGERPAVLVFYRGAWCPYCNLTLRTYQAALLPDLVARDVALVAFSPQTPDGSLSMQEKNELTFRVLSDPANRLAGAVGIVSAPSEAARTVQMQLGLDLTAVNADGTIQIPMPTTVIIDTERVVRWVDVHPDYTTRSEPDQIIAALEGVGR